MFPRWTTTASPSYPPACSAVTSTTPSFIWRLTSASDADALLASFARRRASPSRRWRASGIGDGGGRRGGPAGASSVGSGTTRLDGPRRRRPARSVDSLPCRRRPTDPVARRRRRGRGGGVVVAVVDARTVVELLHGVLVRSEAPLDLRRAVLRRRDQVAGEDGEQQHDGETDEHPPAPHRDASWHRLLQRADHRMTVRSRIGRSIMRYDASASTNVTANRTAITSHLASRRRRPRPPRRDAAA